MKDDDNINYSLTTYILGAILGVALETNSAVGHAP